jgi:hypothetical protein
MTAKTRHFLILWLAGMVGVASILLIDFDALIKILPFQPGDDVPEMTPALKAVSLVQPAVLLGAAVLVGSSLAGKVGLSAPVTEAAASRGDLRSAAGPQMLPGMIGGLLGGLSLVLIAAVHKPFLQPEVLVRIGEFNNILPIPMRLLYGGITEEVLLRWGFMTLIVWAFWRYFQKGQGRPSSAIFIGAILVSSLVFAIGHLPIAFLIIPSPTLAVISFAIFGNSAFGLIAGYLYWKKGLEAAIIAHVLAHVVMIAASNLGVYF